MGWRKAEDTGADTGRPATRAGPRRVERRLAGVAEWVLGRAEVGWRTRSVADGQGAAYARGSVRVGAGVAVSVIELRVFWPQWRPLWPSVCAVRGKGQTAGVGIVGSEEKGGEEGRTSSPHCPNSRSEPEKEVGRAVADKGRSCGLVVVVA